MDHIYHGIKRISHDVSENHKIVDMNNGVRIVTVDGKDLTDKLGIGFDFGERCNRNQGMNLSLSVLSNFKKHVEVPNEFAYRFFKEVISKLDTEWEFTTEQLAGYCDRIYDETHHEEVVSQT